jgi:hypothetical protein
MGTGLKGIAKKPFDDITLLIGPYWWSAKSKEFNSSGKFPLWLLNSAEVAVTRTLFYKIHAGFGGGLLFGKTSKGSYLGYDSHAKAYWEDSLSIADGLINVWRAGGIATFSGMSVESERYGGGDWLRGGFIGGLGGMIKVGDMSERYDWFGNYTLLPLNIGRLGYAGSRKVVESSLGWKLALGAFRWAPPGELQFGGELELGDERETLKNGRRPQLKDYALKALIKHDF